MPDNEKKESGGRRKIIIPIIVLAVIAALTWAGKTYAYGRKHQSTDNAQVDGHIIPVLAKVGGYVDVANIEENQPIKEGALAVKINDEEYRGRLETAKADLAAAQATYGTGRQEGQAQAQVQTATGEHAARTAQITAAEANQKKAHQDLQRMKELADKQIVSRQQLDAAQAAADAADAALTAAREQAAAASAGVSTARAGVRLAQAKVEAAESAVHAAQLQLQYTTIYAPASGLVSKKQIEVGQLVQPGQPLFSIVSDSSVWITANFKETQLSKIRVGQPVSIDVDAYDGCLATGKVSSLSGATGAKFALLPPDNASGNFTKVVQRVPVRIDVTRGCGADRPLRPGMSVTVHVQTD